MGLEWDGLWDGMGWDGGDLWDGFGVGWCVGWDGVGLGGMGWNVEWVVVLKPENHYFVNIDPLKGKLSSQRESFATFLAAL